MALRHRHRSRLLGDSLSERYDAAYFDKWYRHPTHRVKTAAELARQVSFVLHTAEWVLGRRVRTVLDVGCGEGHWYPALRALRPRVAYQGVDPSAYAVRKFGARRHLQQGGIEDLGSLALREQYDLVVCCGMLNYLSIPQLTSGIAQVAQRTAAGVGKPSAGRECTACRQWQQVAVVDDGDDALAHVRVRLGARLR